MNKQDKTFSRTPSDTERKFISNLGKKFAEIMGIATDARTTAENTKSELSKAVATINKEITDKSATIELQAKTITKQGESIANLQTKATEQEASIGLQAEKITEQGESIANLQIKANEQGASIGLLVDNNGVKGSVIVEAINGQSSAKIKADNIVFEGQKLDITVDATNIDGKLTAEQIDAKGLMVENEEGNFATYIKNGKISVVGTKLPDAAGSYFDIPILRFKAFDGSYYEMCVRMTLENPDPDFIGDEAVVPSSIVFRKDGYSLID